MAMVSGPRLDSTLSIKEYCIIVSKGFKFVTKMCCIACLTGIYTEHPHSVLSVKLATVKNMNGSWCVFLDLGAALSYFTRSN